jgi:tellurite resistance protein
MGRPLMVQMQYGEAAGALQSCDLARYLGALLRLAALREVSVPERNVAASVAYLLAEESVRQEAFEWSDAQARTWAELLVPLREPAVARSLLRDACQVAWSDGEMDDVEAAQLLEMARELQVDDELRDRIFELTREQSGAHAELLGILAG